MTHRRDVLLDVFVPLELLIRLRRVQGFNNTVSSSKPQASKMLSALGQTQVMLVSDVQPCPWLSQCTPAHPPLPHFFPHISVTDFTGNDFAMKSVRLNPQSRTKVSGSFQKDLKIWSRCGAHAPSVLAFYPPPPALVTFGVLISLTHFP